MLQTQARSRDGALYMEIKAPDGTALYRGNGRETRDFTVSIREGGVYTIIVEARHGKGIMHTQVRREHGQAGS